MYAARIREIMENKRVEGREKKREDGRPESAGVVPLRRQEGATCCTATSTNLDGILASIQSLLIIDPQIALQVMKLKSLTRRRLRLRCLMGCPSSN